jgi:flagellar L-ring protein precursor FlgH
MTMRKTNFWKPAGIALWAALVIFPGAALAEKSKKSDKPAPPTPLEQYAQDAARQAEQAPAPASGSLWQPGAPLANITRDPRAYRLNDVVTIVVNENLSALSSGTTKTQRSSSAAASVGALGHPFGGANALANLAKMSGNTTLDGEGSTMRQTSLTTAMSARVAAVLPNGYLIVEGHKTVQVNSEQQVIVVRGVIRPTDLASDNTIQSNLLAEMEVSVNGKGVVGDAVRRPSFLYRLLLGLLPF